MPNRLIINICLGLTLLSLLVLQSIAYNEATKEENAIWVSENHEILKDIHEVSSLFQDTQVELRKYLFNKNSSTLKNMNNVIAGLLPALDKLSSAKAINFKQRNFINKEIRPALIENISSIDKIIKTYQKEGQVKAIATFASVEGYILGSKVRKALSDLEDMELEIIIQQSKENKTLAHHWSFILFGSTLFFIIMLVIFFFLINIYLDKKIISESHFHSQKKLFESILNCMSDGVLVRDIEGKFILQNPAAKKLIGDSLEHLQIYTEDRKTQLSEKEFPTTKAAEGEYINNAIYFVKSDAHPNGIYVNVSVRPLISKEGLKRGGIAVFNDITAIKEAHDQLESFNYSVSHDLKAPLGTIMGFTQILIDDHSAECSLEGKDALERIISATTRMKLVIDGLFELSRVKRISIKKELVNLSSMALTVSFDLQRLDCKRKINFIIPPDIEALGDPRLLNIVMTNLINNAYKFTSKQENSVIEFGLIKDNNKVTYFLKDNGAGFDMRHVDKLFSPFERLHAHKEFPGNGIGLATVKQVINKHAGEVWAHAELNKGAIFYFTL